MRTLLTSVALLAAVAFTTRADDAKPAKPDARAMAVIEKAITATGGAEALTKYPVSTAKVKGVLSQQGLEMDFTGEVVIQAPDKFRLELDADVAGMKIKIVQVVSGDKMKMTNDGQPAPLDDMTKAELRASAAVSDLASLVPLTKGKYAVKSEGEEGEFAVLIVTGKDIKELKLYFDKATGLLTKTARKAIVEMGSTAEVLVEVNLSEYKDIQGVKTPTKSVVTHDGKKFITMTALETKYSDKPADAKAFAVDE